MTQEEFDDTFYKCYDLNSDYQTAVYVCLEFIKSLESQIETYEFEMEAYRQCEEQLKNCETALDEAFKRVKELEGKQCD